MPLEIINCALRYSGGASIGSLTDPSPATQDILREYRKALRWLVAKSEWNCQTIAVCPEEIPDVPACDRPQGYPYVFRYPEASLRIASVCYFQEGDCPAEDLPTVHFRIVKIPGAHWAQKVIVTDCKPIQVEYVCLPDECDVRDLDQETRDALTYRVASVLFQVKGDNANAEKYLVLARDSLSEAIHTDGRQGHRRDELQDGFLVEARQW